MNENFINEYLHALTSFSNLLLDLYVRTNVTIHDGKITSVHDMSFFKGDLLHLTQPAFSLEDTRHYDALTEQAKQEYLALSKQASELAAQQKIIPLEYLFRIFHLSYPERVLVILSLTAEVEYRFERIYSYLLDDYNQTRPTIDLVLRILFSREQDRRQWFSTFLQKEPILKRFFPKLFLEDNSRSIITAPLRLDKRILAFIFSAESENHAITSCSEFFWPSSKEIPPLLLQKELPEQLARQIHSGRSKKQLFYLHGEIGSGKKLLLRHLSHKYHLTILHTDISALPRETAAFHEKMEQIYTEALLKNAVLFFSNFEPFDPLEPPKNTTGASLFSSLLKEILSRIFETGNLLFLSSEKPWIPVSQSFFTLVDIPLEHPSEDERCLLWKEMIQDFPVSSSISPDMLATKFSFSAGRIRNSLTKALQLMEWSKETEISSPLLHQACRTQISHRLHNYASLVNAQYTWDDLILPAYQKEQLREACNQIKFHHKVYSEWGFSKKIAYGKGLSLLFYGPPGTGKTMGAQVLAEELEMELYKIDLSTIMSKYIGETQKNLNMVFEEVKKSNSILFFDEADALFGKRSEVQDSRDRYSNAETAYLLQKMEEYDGIVILATNFIQNFDAAYKRRIKFIIDFPFPEPEERRRLWESMFPENAPAEDLDFDFLAEHFELSGSNIKNIVLASAFQAASAQENIQMKHIIHALKNEFFKSGKRLSPNELLEYAELL